MTQQIPLSEADRAPMREEADGTTSIAADLSYMRSLIVNVVFYGLPGPNSDWVLIDTALSVSRGAIEDAAGKRFGARPPQAIILTHGHFDHVGSVVALAEKWDVPVYAHPLERPYLDGTASYPPPDPWVGGGLIALSAPLMPRGPIDLGPRLRTLPEDGSVPGMPGWSWLHTPGHAPGHISLWRPADRSLIAGDAFVTTAQESIYDVATQELEMHGPPRYFTPDWRAAHRSVKILADLAPELAITGHGLPVSGPGMRDALHRLAREFESVAVPEDGRYVDEPSVPEDGSAYRKP